MMASPDLHAFRSDLGVHVFVVDGSRIYDVDDETFDQCCRGAPPAELSSTRTRPCVDDTPLVPASLRSISLNVAQGCNMSCSYCYAEEGRFGAHARLMKPDMARRSVDAFLDQVPPGSDAVLGYMGGEPFLNAGLIHQTTRYAAERADDRGVRLRFSVTTNATLLRDQDVALLSEFPFSVAVSLDGDRTTSDCQRPMRDGRSSYDRALAGLAKLTRQGRRPRHVSVRATVTPRSGRLTDMLDAMLAQKVNEAGFAPVLVSPDPRDAFTASDFERFLEEMIECGARALDALRQRRRSGFSNFETALQELHRGAHRPYPCGAAAGYASVSAEGNLFGCHRGIDDDRFAIGSIGAGPDDSRRTAFLSERHVLRQEPCRSCWARFLCGGGCHQEVIARGRVGCGYIRGWLHFCLSAYAELSLTCPGYFPDPDAYFDDANWRAEP